jgi:hypothetical protein
VRYKLLALAFALTLAVPMAASADQHVTGALDLGFSNAGQLGVKGDDWSGGIAALYSYDHFNTQIDGSYDRLEPSVGSGINLWDMDASFFWRDRKGTLGATVAYGSISQIPGSVQVLSYGAFGEWYAAHDLTLRVKGGGFNGGSGIEGWHAGTSGEFYPLDDLGITIDYSYLNGGGGHIHNIGADVEYLISHEYPLSIGAGYQHTGLGNINAFLIKLRYRFGLEGTLVGIDRNGPVSWDGKPPF